MCSPLPVCTKTLALELCRCGLQQSSWLVWSQRSRGPHRRACLLLTACRRRCCCWSLCRANATVSHDGNGAQHTAGFCVATAWSSCALCCQTLQADNRKARTAADACSPEFDERGCWVIVCAQPGGAPALACPGGSLRNCTELQSTWLIP